jgi:RNA binding exosome subunit
MIINIPNEHIDTLTGFLGQDISNPLTPDHLREAYENIYTQLISDNAELSYFAKDGNYGNATELVVVNTEKWTGEEWAIIEENSDEDRPAVATQLTELIESGEIVR